MNQKFSLVLPSFRFQFQFSNPGNIFNTNPHFWNDENIDQTEDHIVPSDQAKSNPDAIKRHREIEPVSKRWINPGIKVIFKSKSQKVIKKFTMFQKSEQTLESAEQTSSR